MLEKLNDPSIHKPVPVNLRQPWLAAILAWLCPGAGHLYQQRYAKGALYMVCILSTYFFGFALGEGRVVYASFKSPDVRYAYLCQVGVGLPALPALEQARRQRNNLPPLFGSELMMPPGNVNERDGNDTLARWHEELRGYFELATLYTMVAGLLNILAIYDAYAGPVFPQPEDQTHPPPQKKRGRKKGADGDADDSGNTGPPTNQSTSKQTAEDRPTADKT